MGLKKRIPVPDFVLSALSARIVSFEKKELVFQKSTEKHLMGLVLEGLVYLCVENEAFERHILQIFRPGDMLSQSMLAQVGYGSSYLITKSASKLACFSRDSFLKFCLEYPGEIRVQKEALFKDPQTELLSHSYILHQKSIREKLRVFLKREQLLQGSEIIELPFPYADLADYLSVDRTSMMKEIGKMKKEGLLAGKNHRLTLLF